MTKIVFCFHYSESIFTIFFWTLEINFESIFSIFDKQTLFWVSVHDQRLTLRSTIRRCQTVSRFVFRNFFFRESFNQLDVSINEKFRRNSDSKIRVFSFFSIINFESSNIIRFITNQNSHFAENTFIESFSETSSFIYFNRIEKVSRFSMIQISSFVDVNSNLWTAIIIVAQIFNVVQHSTNSIAN